MVFVGIVALRAIFMVLLTTFHFNFDLICYRMKSVNRRNFIKGAGAVMASSMIPWQISCVALISDPNNQLSDIEFNTLIALQNHLFPASGEAPSAEQINAAPFFTKTIGDPHKDADVVRFLKSGFTLLSTTCEEQFDKPFTQLTESEKEYALQQLASTSKGENWLSAHLTIIFEALFSDPLYGANTQQKGWQFIRHKAGEPRPKSQNLYSF